MYLSKNRKTHKYKCCVCGDNVYLTFREMIHIENGDEKCKCATCKNTKIWLCA